LRLEYLIVGDSRMRLRGSKGREGEGKVGTAVALTVLFGPIGLIKHGKNVEIKEGTPLTAYVDQDFAVAAKWVHENNLGKAVSATPEGEPADTTAKPSQTSPVESASGVASEPGTLTVTSTPETTDILVDGAFVGSTPATLKLTQGKHTVRLSCVGYRDWFKEVLVFGGSDAKLNAVLKKSDEEQK
jgi:hypothetical protein